MTVGDTALIVSAVGGLAVGIGTLVYTSPGRAWRLLVESLNARVTQLEKERDENRKELQHAEAEVRRLRTIRSVLEDLLRRAGIEIPAFQPGEHPDIAPERRAQQRVVVEHVGPKETDEKT